MFQWLQSLDTLGIVFVCLALPASVILLIQIIMTLVGMGGGGDADFDGDADFGGDAEPDGVFGDDDPTMPDADSFNDGGALNLFSFRGIIAFFVTFGWVGLAVESSGAPAWVSLLVGFAAGVLMMFAVALLLRALFRLQSDGTVNPRNAVGVSGTVYLTIPAKRGGKGKVNLLVQGAYREFDAVTDSEEPIKTGAEVTVRAVTGGDTLVVMPRS